MIARVLLSDWRMVKDMVESYGGQFICILQPLAYFSKTRLDHIKLDEGLGDQYEAVYKKTVNLLASDFAVLKENFLDLRQALDKDEYIYIDWYHLSPNGNEMIARKITEEVTRRQGGTGPKSTPSSFHDRRR